MSMSKTKIKVPRAIKRLFPKAEQCKDATQRVCVTTTAKDNAEGRKMQPDDCALAKAAKRQFKADGAVIGLTYSYIIKGKTAVRFTTSHSVSREITSFDRHSDFAPGRYTLSPVSPSQRIGKKKYKSKTLGARKVHRIVHKETARVRTMR